MSPQRTTSRSESAEDGSPRPTRPRSRRSRSSRSAKTSRRPRAGRPVGARRWRERTPRSSGRPTRSIPSSSASGPRARASKRSCAARLRGTRATSTSSSATASRSCSTGDELAVRRSVRPGRHRAPRAVSRCRCRPRASIVGLLALFFTEIPNAEEALARMERFLEQAAPALGRALRAERKTVGMLHAIERLTNLYDLSKAFGSTIDIDELSALIVRKAADIATAEAASPLVLRAGERRDSRRPRPSTRTTTSTHPPDAVGGHGRRRRRGRPGGDPAQPHPADRPGGHGERGLPHPVDPGRARSSRTRSPIGALVLANKRGRHPEFSAEDEELLAGPLPPGRARAAQRRASTRPRRRSRSSTPCSPSAARSRRRSTSTRSCTTIVNATAALIAVRPLRDRDPGRGQAPPRRGLGHRSRSTARTRRSRRTEELLAVGLPSRNGRRRHAGRRTAASSRTGPRPRRSSARSSRESGLALLLRRAAERRGGQARRARLREPRADRLRRRTRATSSAILVNQATVAVRNAQLYTAGPAARVPASRCSRSAASSSRSRSASAAAHRRRRSRWRSCVLFVVPWRFRVGGPARVLPGRRAAVTAGGRRHRRVRPPPRGRPASRRAT